MFDVAAFASGDAVAVRLRVMGLGGCLSSSLKSVVTEGGGDGRCVLGATVPDLR